ncbi:hypothetical protein [Vulcaniibacterium tengchongense]|uniref:Uncharacterized protein n=1 Tax=Vulcaniibacterium tengchongense TaxID=1273429 RepID=A0A3N4VEB9_9GAMM|nr:hypothetical protein [Vulcaniibacterium tengchongense]RPE79845.1 hypothetical protein EDC50_1674 [Vulcaniibacterium tengchongense]
MNPPSVSPPAALSAFLRGVERRGAVLAELQTGDAEAGDAALVAAMTGFRAEAEALPMSAWPQRFWARLLAEPGLRRRTPVALALDPTDRLAELGAGPRAALLLRLAAGLDDGEAAAALGVTPASYRLALQRALPRQADGRADPEAWQRLREQIHRRIKTLPPPRLLRLGRAREALLRGEAVAPGPVADAAPGPRRPRWLLPLLWALLALCALALAATFVRPPRPADAGGDAAVRLQRLPEEPPAAGYAAESALLTHRDFDLLADPAGEAGSADLAFFSWLAAQHAAGAVAPPPLPVEPGAATPATAAAGPDGGAETLDAP